MTAQGPIPPGPLTLDDLQALVHAWVSQFAEGYFPPLENLARLTEEVGEVARELSHELGTKKKKPTELEGSVAGELGDVLFVLACLANQLGLRLQTTFLATMDKYAARDADRWTRLTTDAGET